LIDILRESVLLTLQVSIGFADVFLKNCSKEQGFLETPAPTRVCVRQAG
jgi:hypothetical protein